MKFFFVNDIFFISSKISLGLVIYPIPEITLPPYVQDVN